METQTTAVGNEDGGGGGKNTSNTAGSFMCRQSSARWTPTTEQIRILKDMYYNNGVRSPTAEQIQRISGKLRQYGKIEGKNVFYWFQNHKARERQKKRFNTDHIPTVQHRNIPNPPPPENHLHLNAASFYSKFSNNNNFNNAGFLSVGSSARGYGYGSMAMERSFRDCSITPGPVGVGGSMGPNIAWGGVDPLYHSTSFVDQKRKHAHQTLKMYAEEEDEEEESVPPEIETLPLFPMHGDIGKRDPLEDYFSLWRQAEGGEAFAASAAGGGSRAPVELTLNSYGSSFTDFP